MCREGIAMSRAYSLYQCRQPIHKKLSWRNGFIRPLSACDLAITTFQHLPLPHVLRHLSMAGHKARVRDAFTLAVFLDLTT